MRWDSEVHDVQPKKHGGVRWRINAHERALLKLARAITNSVMANAGLSAKDRRSALRLVLTFPCCRSLTGAKKTLAAWRSMPAYLQYEVAKLAMIVGAADELQRIVDSGAP